MADDLKPHCHWTVDTALQHVLTIIGANDHRVEQRFLDLHGLIASQLAAMQQAVLKAEAASDRRLEGMNEFRNTLGDQQRNLMPRLEAERAYAALGEKIASLEKQHDALIAERQGLRGGWGYAVGVVGFVLAIVSIIALVVKLTP